METVSEKKTLNKEASDRLSFITFIIPEFARSYKRNLRFQLTGDLCKQEELEGDSECFRNQMRLY
ncbi:MAG: hypothetical protein LBF62_07550 [Tannerellaceae bacterium]|jgi:hypothetical protein|nr:hypothetical protein [Tannerellaceae bacterium]